MNYITQNSVLIETKNGGFVDLERLNTFLDYIKVCKSITKNGFYLGGLIMDTSAYCINSLFVDRESLKPYYIEESLEDISV